MYTNFTVRVHFSLPFFHVYISTKKEGNVRTYQTHCLFNRTFGARPRSCNLTSAAYYLQYGGQEAKKNEEQTKEICK
jgi:uncharacterized protein YvpB